jgi:hypothetical protein
MGGFLKFAAGALRELQLQKSRPAKPNNSLLDEASTAFRLYRRGIIDKSRVNLPRLFLIAGRGRDNRDDLARNGGVAAHSSPGCIRFDGLAVFDSPIQILSQHTT